MRLQILGAAQTVTGSKYLLTLGELRVLVDCGLFQGFKNLRLKNWDKFPIDPSTVDAVLLTHAHLDHSGYLPLLIKNGFKGKIYSTAATKALSSILLPDSGFLQEEETKFANKKGFSKHKPALPLYTQADGERAIESFVAVGWKERHQIFDRKNLTRLSFEFHPAGHLFGAATILVSWGSGHTIAFSGDLGRPSDPITRQPNFDLGAEYLVVESTYGNRKHLDSDPKEELKKVILRTIDRKGTIVIPSFAVGRAQIVLYYIRQLKLEGSIPDVPVFLNSPMALQANNVFQQHSDESKVSEAEARAICSTAKPIMTVEESKRLNEREEPCIIIAASGMATGGRVIHHLKTFLPNPKNTILFVGFQAGGTRGDALVHGAKEVKIHGEYWPVHAEIAQIDTMSAHADASEVLSWIQNLKMRPKRIFVTHGEPAAADDLRRNIVEQFSIEALVPEQGQEFNLGPLQLNKN